MDFDIKKVELTARDEDDGLGGIIYTLSFISNRLITDEELEYLLSVMPEYLKPIKV